MCRLCFAWACSADQTEKEKKKKRRSKRHFTETWSRTKSHKRSSGSRIPEPCRRHENSGSIQQEPFFPWHRVCTGIKWDPFFFFLPSHNCQKKKLNANRKKLFSLFPNNSWAMCGWYLNSAKFPCVAETMANYAFLDRRHPFSQEELFLFLETGGYKCEWKNKCSVWVHLHPHS